MIKSAAVLAAIACSIITTFALIEGFPMLAAAAAVIGSSMILSTFFRRGFLMAAVSVVGILAPAALFLGHPWIAGITAYVGMTMMFLAWNHAVHSLNRQSDERQNAWSPATEQR